MRKIFVRPAVLLILVLMALTLVACSGSSGSDDDQNPVQPQEETSGDVSIEESDNTSPGSTAVVYFSATGNTKRVAEIIAKLTDADLYEIVPAQEYTEADLDWHDEESRTTIEQNDKSARPEMAGDEIDISPYTTIYLGFPIWWGEEPRIMDTFVESCDFNGKTVIPFCTSGISGIGNSGANLAENAGSGNWKDGERFSGGASEDEIKEWVGKQG